MKERTALLILFAIAVVGSNLVLAALSWLGAGSRLVAVTCLVLIGVAADTGARVVLHYRR